MEHKLIHIYQKKNVINSKKNDEIWGCGRPFQLTRESDDIKIIPCDYI